LADTRWRLVRARRDAVPDSVRRFSARARRNRLRRAAPLLTVAAVAGLIGIGAAVVWFTPVVAVDEVRVTGASLVSADDVRAAAEVPVGRSLARVDVHGVHERVAALPPVGRVSVRRDLPGTVVIAVTERTPTAVVEQSAAEPGLWLIDASGVVYTKAVARPPGLALLRIPAPSKDDPTTRAALTVLRALPPDLLAPMAVLAADAPARIRLEFTDGRTIVWGDATENAEKVRVVQVLITRPGRTIDVSAPSLVTIR
jgi:cell division protein FtsQ